MDLKYLTRPQDQRFWKWIGVTLQPFGLGSRQWWGYPEQHTIFLLMYYVTSIFGPVSLVSQAAYFALYHSEYPFFELGNIFTVIMVTFIIVMKLMCARKVSYETIMRQFFDKIHLFYYTPRNAFCDKILMKVERYSRWCALILSFSLGADFFFWMTVPIINNVLSGAFNSNGTVKLQSCLYMMTPFDYEHNINNWVIMHIVNFYTAGFGCALFAVSDTILFSIIFHLIGRIKILKNNLNELSESFESYNEIEIREKLGICVRDHVSIKHYFHEMQDAFGLSVTGYYAFNMIFDSLLIMELKYGDMSLKIAYILMVVIYVGGLIAMSLVMEEIRKEGDSLPEAVYAVPWERMTIPNRRIVVVLLGRVQPILVFKAFAGLEAGVRPTISIMKSTFSYYVMLKSKTENGM